MAELDRIDKKILDILQRDGQMSTTELAQVLHVPDVQECHLGSGNFYYLVKARLGGLDECRSLLGDILTKLPIAAQSHRKG